MKPRVMLVQVVRTNGTGEAIFHNKILPEEYSSQYIPCDIELTRQNTNSKLSTFHCIAFFRFNPLWLHLKP